MNAKYWVLLDSLRWDDLGDFLFLQTDLLRPNGLRDFN